MTSIPASLPADPTTTGPLPPAAGRQFRILIDPALTPEQIARHRRRGVTVEPRGVLIDAETREVRITATLAHIERAVIARGLTVIERREATVLEAHPVDLDD